MSRIRLDRGDHIVRRMRPQLFDKRRNDPPPLTRSLTKGGQNRVVQIEQNRAWQVFHQVIAAGACGTPLQNSPSCPKKIRAPAASRLASLSREASIACRS